MNEAIKNSKSSKNFEVYGAGFCGVLDMQRCLTDDEIVFGLLQIEVGSGTFKRIKNIFVHFNAADYPKRIKRMKLNEKAPDAREIFGHTHASLEMTKKEQCCVDYIFDRLKSALVSDDIDAAALVKMKEEYAKKVAEMLKKKEKELASAESTTPTVEEGEPAYDAKTIVKLLHEEMSPINWAVFRPHKNDLIPMSYGHGNLEGLRSVLRDDCVQYALLRLAFGVGRFRRTHWVFVHWSGQKMKGIKKMTERAEHNSYRQYMKPLLEPHGAEIHVHEVDQVSLENIILRVRDKVVVDGNDDYSSGMDVKTFSVESFRAALHEEEEYLVKKKKEKTMAPKKAPKPTDSAEVLVGRIRDAENPLQWVLLKPR